MSAGRHPYQSNRYRPGYWNGLCGANAFGQYFNRESEDRIAAMMEISTALRSHGISFSVTRWRKYYRIMIAKEDFLTMGERLKKQIAVINEKNTNGW